MAKRKELLIALLATLFFGAAGGIFGSTVNNYLSDVHHFTAEGRGWLEFPRELPGFLMIFVVGALLAWFRETQMAAIATLFTALGAIGYAYLSPSTGLLILFTSIWSLGDHIIFAVEGPIGLQLARDGNEGKRLGQFGGARNLGIIGGVGLVYFLSKILGDRYSVFYTLSAAFALVAGCIYIRLQTGRGIKRSSGLLLKRKYKVFYAVSALFGIRKQIFMVFGSWVLVKLHHVPVSTVALLYFVAAAVGVLFRPLLGEIIDWFGERTVLATDQFMLALVCLSYAFASTLLPKPYDLYLLYSTYVLDSVLYALRVALTTYLKKIADQPSDITPSISVGITIDHAIAMSIPIFSGYVWERWGYQWVFVMASVIALLGVVVCVRMIIPRAKPSAVATPEPELI